ncbi:NFAT activation molecule 1 isoform X1 [Sarcophilus harrisii]|nr:NFAT activation molecule 1 isoform X1 [Sarcophilus harrisii]
MAFRFLGLILLPWTLQVGGNQILRQLGDPIQVVLAPFEPFGLKLTCEFTYRYTQALKNYTCSYHYVDLKGKQSPSFLVKCNQAPGVENVTQTDKCPFTLKNLHDASATGTYYCQVKLQNSHQIKANGVFILVRDAGYIEPPKGHKKLLLLLFTSLLAVLSILGTGLLLWKAKSQRKSVKKMPNQEGIDSEKNSADPKLEHSGSLYIALQPHSSEVYDSLQLDISIPSAERSPPIQRQYQEGAEELNIIYENF